jgi:Kef-type K+ transport system membrane component KefB
MIATLPRATEIPRRSTAGVIAGIGMIVVPVALIIVTLSVAWSSGGDAHPVPNSTTGATVDVFGRLLVALPIILGVCYLAGRLFRRLGQAAVIGEIFAGIALGPSLLGALWPAGSAWLFPQELIGAIDLLAQLGLIFFMFLVGYELNLGTVRERSYTVIVVSQVSIVVPMLSGTLLAFLLYPSFGNGISFGVFALAISVSLSVTAFPVLARILADREMSDIPLGVLALTCAAIGDVVAWCLLTVVVALAGRESTGGVGVTIALTAAFVAVLLFAVRPLPARTVPRLSEQAALSLLLGGTMLAALGTHAIGIHALFGAFLFGTVSPRDALPVHAAAAKLEGFSLTLLLTLFFVATGLRPTSP